MRRLRQWYGKLPLTQEQLSSLSGVSSRQIRDYEKTRGLPKTLESLLSIALALRVPFETLIAPEWLEEKARVIDERRRELGLGGHE